MRGNPPHERPRQAGPRSIPACAGEPARPARSASAPRVYPRVCGGTTPFWAGLSALSGLSPRVRGNPNRPDRAHRCGRSIPACAGEPDWGTARPYSVGVYPRVCGGTRYRVEGRWRYQGLSPRVRGNLLLWSVRGLHSGSIPACAGEPSGAGVIAGSGRVYPRVCGGTPIPVESLEHLAGLSPRVRGNQPPHRAHAGAVGSIPACAGEPPRRSRRTGSSTVYPRVCGGTPPGASPAGSRRRVYPRVCGGTSACGSQTRTSMGLSPRVRGNHDHPADSLSLLRSIPACAGEPWSSGTSRAASRVYPRVCGGTGSRGAGLGGAPGLSPRVRGNPGCRRAPTMRRGSIPACAGEPRVPSSTDDEARVYPRVCGGTLDRGQEFVRASGLSPRVRGNREDRHRPREGLGSIPACAGEPSRRWWTSSLAQVYPRVCGGTRRRPTLPRLDAGLSPRVRGNHKDARARFARSRSIPACAGEPLGLRLRHDAQGVYPRVCGGTSGRPATPEEVEGLSPRVRGNRRGRGRPARSGRSIPACAGEPPAAARREPAMRVYPRVCGGTRAASKARCDSTGLSPRVRGNRVRAGLGRPVCGSIPACAGEPPRAGARRRRWTVYPRVCGGTVHVFLHSL